MSLKENITARLVAAWRRFRYGDDELIVLVDDDGTPIGTAPKLKAHNSDTKLHLAFSVFIFNRRGELLLQQRSHSKKTWPGVWSNSCCGHVMPHEATTRGAERRLKFELGLSGIELVNALPDFRYRAEKDGVVENEICPVLIGVSDTEPVPNPSEVAGLRWIDWNEFVKSIGEHAPDISPWAEQEARLLSESDVFRNWFAREIRASEASAPVC